MARLKDIYNSEIRDAMIKKFGYKNIMEVPKLEKIVINMGVGEAKENAKVLDSAVRDIEIISGQHAVVTKAKKSVANFKIREGMPIGCKVTLRGEKMYDLLIVSSTLHFPVYVTSGVSTLTHLMEEATMLLDLRSSSYSLRSSMTRLTRQEAWTSFSLRQLRRTKRLREL